MFKSKKLNFSRPYNDELTVFVRVNIDNLKELSKLRLSKHNMLDSKKIEAINEMKTRNAIFTS